jgi:hypothetical protein
VAYATVVPAHAANGALVAGVGEEFTAVEAGVVGEGTKHGVVSKAKRGVIAIGIHGLFNHVIVFVAEAVRAASAIGFRASSQVSCLE